MPANRSYKLMIRNMMAWMHYTTFAQEGGAVSYCAPLTIFDAHQNGTAANFMVWEDPYTQPAMHKQVNDFFSQGQTYLGWSYGLPGSSPAPAPGNWQAPELYPGMMLDSFEGNDIFIQARVSLLETADINDFSRLEYIVHPDTPASFFQALGFALVHDSLSFALLFKEGKQVLGAGIAFWDGNSWGIYMVATHPLHRKQGIGTAITRSLLAETQHRKSAPVCLQASPDAQRLYLINRFRVVAPTWAWVPGSC